jgi:tRNA (guanine-N7-)-methyltransferase
VIGTRDRDRQQRQVVSFVRRSTRMRPPHQRAWDQHRDRFLIPVRRLETSTSVAPGQPLDLTALFGRSAPLVVEIGPGGGEALIAAATGRPEVDLLAFEVHQPSLARLIKLLADAAVDNVRLVEADAVAGLRELVPAGSIDELWTYFPDPWPKARHHKRRILTREFADLAVSRIRPGGRWRLATDWADYAEQMRTVLDGHPELTASQPAAHPADRPLTRFEQRGIDAGREIVDLDYRRR